MPLLDRYSHPPGHFVYREPKTGMAFGEDGVGFYDVVDALFKHRASNPLIFDAADRAMEACEMAVDNHTCRRLRNAAKWCQQPIETLITETNEKPSAKKSDSNTGCATCGGRKKRA